MRDVGIASRTLVECPAGRQFARIDEGFPATEARIDIVIGRKKPNAGGIGSLDVVALGGVLGEIDRFLMERLFPRPTISVGFRVKR